MIFCSRETCLNFNLNIFIVKLLMLTIRFKFFSQELYMYVTKICYRDCKILPRFEYLLDI